MNITQSNDNTSSNNYNFGVSQAPSTSQVQVVNGDCSSLSNATVTVAFSGTNSDQVTVTITPNSPTTNLAGQAFVIGIKYSTKSIVGLPKPNPTTVSYTFTTVIGTTTVATDPAGVQLVTP